MKLNKLKKFMLLLTFIALPSFASSFDLITLGSKGGIQDGNLTAFLIKETNSEQYISLDAGSMVNGLIAANSKNAFKDIQIPKDSELSNEGYILTNHIKGYFISHPHLDHIAGMIISSPDDSAKPIYGLKQTNDAIAKNYFNWSAWPNFTDRGTGYKLNQYNYVDLPPYEWAKIKDTKLEAMVMPLAHSGMISSAILIKNEKGEAFVYFGDTGPDLIEKSGSLYKAWQQIAPFAKDKKLKGMVIEVSYLNQREDKKLFGHLTPNWLMKELTNLAELAGKDSLKSLPVVVSHIKYSLKKQDSVEQIKAELKAGNKFDLKFIFPEQGDSYQF